MPSPMVSERRSISPSLYTSSRLPAASEQVASARMPMSSTGTLIGMERPPSRNLGLSRGLMISGGGCPAHA